jgi:hypothetical protein
VCTLGRLRVARPSPSGPTTPGGKNLAPGASDAGLSQTHRARLDRASTQLVARTHEALLGASCDRARRLSRGATRQCASPAPARAAAGSCFEPARFTPRCASACARSSPEARGREPGETGGRVVRPSTHA